MNLKIKFGQTVNTCQFFCSNTLLNSAKFLKSGRKSAKLATLSPPFPPLTQSEGGEGGEREHRIFFPR